MQFSPARFRAYAADLSQAVYQLSEESRMSAQSITGLADVIRQARVALAGVPAVADDIKTTTASVLAKVKQVQALTDELKSAEVELTAVIGNTSNGAPPLETITDSAPVIPAPSPLPTVNVVHDDTGVVDRPKLAV